VSTTYHKQCKLEKRIEQGVYYTTHSWIPARYAKVGKLLDLKDDDGNWDHGWTVKEVWATKPTNEVLARENYHRKHRDGSDARRDSDGWETPHGRRAPVG